MVKKPSSKTPVTAIPPIGAFSDIQAVTGAQAGNPPILPMETAEKAKAVKKPKKKNPAAVTLGRLGGLKGGKARAKKLSAAERQAIAAKAAKTRWKKK